MDRSVVVRFTVIAVTRLILINPASRRSSCASSMLVALEQRPELAVMGGV